MVKKLIPFRYIFLFLGLGLFTFIGWLLIYLGVFKDVLIVEKSEGPFLAIYLEHRGAYHKIGDKIREVETWAKEQGVPCTLTFGEYIDDPRTIEEGRLTSFGGCIFPAPLENQDQPKKPDSNTENKIDTDISRINQLKLPPNFNKKYFPNKSYIQALFEGSPGIGPLVVYPKVEKYFTAHNLRKSGPVIEIYEIKDSHSKTGMITRYLFQN